MTHTHPKADIRTFEHITVGDTASSKHTITDEMVEAFAQITKDLNPLHMEEAYALSTPHKKRVVHGMLTASLLSELVGMHLPGKFSLILSQSTQFKNPVYIGDEIQVTGTVQQKSTATRTVTLSLIMKRTEEVVIRGEVVVLVEDTN